jgi:hypothetical protein
MFSVEGVVTGRFENLVSNFKTALRKDISVKCRHKILIPITRSLFLSFSILVSIII